MAFSVTADHARQGQGCGRRSRAPITRSPFFTKARILDAVREAKGDAAAQPIDHLKKTDIRARPSASSPAQAVAARAPQDSSNAEAEHLPAFLARPDEESVSGDAGALAAE